MTGHDVIVVGLGAMGSATLHQLAARGLRVLGIERFGIPHGLGSSGGDTRLIRKAYFEHPDYVPLLERAYRNWRELQDHTGEQLLYDVGALYLGLPGGELVAGSQRAADVHGLPLERVDEQMLARDYPPFRCPDGYVALFEQDAGFLLCERAVRAFAARAMDLGAELIAGERVLGWSAAHGEVRLTTDRGGYTAGALVITAGSWSGALLRHLGIPLQVTRQPLFWIHPGNPGAFALGRCPCWAVQRPDRPGLIYGVPGLSGTLAPQLGVKVARHAPGEAVDPDQVKRPPEHTELAALLADVSPFVPDLNGPMTGCRTCMYTLSADGHFIVDVHPDHDNVVFGCGFSGHGFKFAPVIGEALADLIVDGTSTLPIDFLGLR